MITYLKLAVFLFVFGVTLIASAAHADGRGSQSTTSNHHSTNAHSRSNTAHETNSQENQLSVIGGYNSNDTSIEARVNFEERMAERLAEREAEIIVRQAEQAALLTTNSDALVDDDIEEPLILETTTSGEHEHPL